MGLLVLAIYLIIVGIVTLIPGTAIPTWVEGLLALIAGLILLATGAWPYINKVQNNA